MSATIKQIAELAGVAPTTVSLVLNGHSRISEKTRQEVLRIAEELDYYPNHSGKLLKQGRTDSIAVLSSYFQNIYKMEFVNGVEAQILQTKYQLRHFLSVVGEEFQKTKEILFGKMADAVILLSVLPDLAFMERMRKAKKHIVLVEETLRGYPGVGFDNFTATYQAVEYLAKSGRRKIAISLGLKAYMGHSFVDERLKGYIAALRDLGLDHSQIIDVPSYSLESGRSLFDQFPDSGMPDAMLCASGDISAAGFLQEALARGVSVPDDIAVVGFDDSIIARTTTPGLTTVRQPVQEMGRAAVDLAVALLEGTDPDAASRILIFPPELIIRQTA